MQFHSESGISTRTLRPHIIRNTLPCHDHHLSSVLFELEGKPACPTAPGFSLSCYELRKVSQHKG